MPAPLALTSPLTRGSRVKAAQKKLDKGNVFKGDYLRGSVDGIFGEETARACRRAKFWLGYPTKEQAPIYGPFLDGFLSGSKKLPADYLKRRQARIKAAGQKPLRVKAVERLTTKVGYVEKPGNNNVFGVWYGFNGVPYCAMAVTWAYVLSGSKAFSKGSRYAYCPWIERDARAGDFGLQVVREPLPGDVVLFDWGRDSVSDHVGLFERWIAGAEGSEFHSIEANTSPDDRGSQSNGGGVYRRVRRIAQVECFVRVGR